MTVYRINQYRIACSLPEKVARPVPKSGELWMLLQSRIGSRPTHSWKLHAVAAFVRRRKNSSNINVLLKKARISINISLRKPPNCYEHAPSLVTQRAKPCYDEGIDGISGPAPLTSRPDSAPRRRPLGERPADTCSRGFTVQGRGMCACTRSQ